MVYEQIRAREWHAEWLRWYLFLVPQSTPTKKRKPRKKKTTVPPRHSQATSEATLKKARSAVQERLDLTKKVFLEAFAKTGIIGKALVVCDRSRSAYLNWLHDPEFKAAFEAARNEFAETLEENVLGIADDVGNKSQLGANIFMLKALKPNTYRENTRVEVSGTITHELGELTDSELDGRIAECERKLSNLESNDS